MKRLASIVIAAAGLAASAASVAVASEWSPLVEPAGLARLIEEDGALVVDIRSVRDYGAGHVETAVNVPYHAWRGPNENPGALIDEEKLTLTLQQIGVEPDSTIVVTYQGRDAADFGGAARVYWTLKSAGVERIAILNGGIEAWREAGLPLSRVEGANFPSEHEFGFASDWLIEREGVGDVLAGLRDATLVDARPAAFFSGRRKHDLARATGTLPGAILLDYVSWFTRATGPGYRFDAEPETIRALAREAGWQPGEEIVSFCNTGHWSAINWFALSEIAGIEGVKLYPESMVGWTQSDNRVAIN